MGPDHDPVATVENHRELLAAVRMRDSELARMRMNEHFRNLEERILRATQHMQPLRKGQN